MLIKSTNRGIKLSINDAAVAGKYFKPKKKAPLPKEKTQIPIIDSLIHIHEDREVKGLDFCIKKGLSIRKARKYLDPAIDKGPINGSSILTKIKDVAQIVETKIPNEIEAIDDKRCLLFIRIIL